MVSKEEGPFSRVAHGQKERREPLKSGLDLTSGMLRMRAHIIYSVEMKKTILKIAVCLILLNMKCELSREGT